MAQLLVELDACAEEAVARLEGVAPTQLFDAGAWVEALDELAAALGDRWDADDWVVSEALALWYELEDALDLVWSLESRACDSWLRLDQEVSEALFAALEDTRVLLPAHGAFRARAALIDLARREDPALQSLIALYDEALRAWEAWAFEELLVEGAVEELVRRLHASQPRRAPRQIQRAALSWRRRPETGRRSGLAPSRPAPVAAASVQGASTRRVWLGEQGAEWYVELIYDEVPSAESVVELRAFKLPAPSTLFVFGYEVLVSEAKHKATLTYQQLETGWRELEESGIPPVSLLTDEGDLLLAEEDDEST
jgi:hypothetical protein